MFLGPAPPQLGSKINKTSYIDRLANEGMRFTKGMVTNSLCAPSRATLLTGKFNHKNGFLQNGYSFDSEQQTFPKQAPMALKTLVCSISVLRVWVVEQDLQ